MTMMSLWSQAPYLDYIGAGHNADITVTTSNSEGPSTGAKTVDGSGLSGNNHNNNVSHAWFGQETQANPVPGRGASNWIHYDFGHQYALGASTIWNFNEEGYTEAGMRSVTIDTSVDGTSWTEWGTFEIARASGDDNYAGVSGPNLSGVTARYLVITQNSSWGEPDATGLSEIKVNLSTSAATACIDAQPGGNYMLNLRTASNASMSQLQQSTDLLTWYAMSNIAGASTDQNVMVQPGANLRRFYRLATNNDATAIPLLIMNEITIARGQGLIIGSQNFSISDTDSAAAALVFQVSGVMAGQFELTSAPGTPILSFTQNDVNSGRIRFVHDGSSTAPSFLLGIQDGGNQVIPVAGNVTYNDSSVNLPPALAANSMEISTGQTLPLTTSILMATDADTLATDLTLTVSNVVAGFFSRASSPSLAITSFTQQEVNNGLIQFSHNNTITAPSYDVSVSDGENTTTPAPAMVSFFPGGGNGNEPMLIANSQATFIGSNTVIGTAHIDAIDSDSPVSSISYVVTGISGGQFERLSSPGVAITSFSQTEVNNRAIRFLQDGTATKPAYTVRATDGTSFSAPNVANISFCDGTRTSEMTAGEISSFENLIQISQVTHTVIASGKWSDAAVWENGNLPGTGARIHIPSELAVVVDSELTPEFESIRIDGMLRFLPNVNTRLKVDTLVTSHCARLEVGTAEIPIADTVHCEIIFADDGPIDTTFDFAQLGRGAILHGKTIIYGAVKTNKVALAVHPATGASTLQLVSVPTGWKVGDELIITGTTPNDPKSDEIRMISAMSGTNITLSAALTKDHIAPYSDLNVYVANATRNVVFRSENATVARRGHIMIMHTLEADINYARFYQLGRTDKRRRLDDTTFDVEDGVGNQASAFVGFTTTSGPRTNIRGRYVLHFHRGGTNPTTTPGVVNGCVAYDGPGWGFVSHSAHAQFLNNVTYAIQGTGYYTEAGDEIGEMVGNIAIRTVNDVFQYDSGGGAIDPDLGSQQQEFGNDGDGYWLSGMLVAMKDNVSAGSSAHGIIYWVDGLVEADIPRGRASIKVADIPNGHLIPNRDTIPTWWAPLAECSGNECYSSSIGFRSRYIHSQSYIGEGGSAFHASPPQAYIDLLEPTVDQLTVWNNRDGVLLNYNDRVSVTNSRIIGIGAVFVDDSGTANSGVGLDQGTEITNGPGRLHNVSIEGFEMGYVAPRSGQWDVTNLTLKNVTDVLFRGIRLEPRTFTMNNINFGSLAGTAVSGRNGRRNIVLEAYFDQGRFQPYWFVMPDRITLDGQGIYYDEQAANYTVLESIPIVDDPITIIPNGYANKTNQQLLNTYGYSFRGAITPAGASTDSRISGGLMGPASPAPTVFPPTFDMSNEGLSPEPAKGGPVPELTNSRLRVKKGEAVVMMETNFNTTDTNTGFAGLTYTVSNVTNGQFAHRDTPQTAITTFTQAEVNGGVIRFIHNNSNSAPSFNVRVSDGSTTTSNQAASVVFDG